MNTIGIFSTPISLINNAIDLSISDLKKINSFKYTEKAHLNLFTDNYYVLYDLIDVKKRIEDYLNNYGKDILGLTNKNELYITNSWCVKTLKNGYHPAHSHPNSLISGVFYIDVGQNQNIIFEYESSVFKKFDFCIDRNNTSFNTNRYVVPVRKNDLILFPSWLKHEVQINTTETTRLVLGFNVFIKGEMGNDDYPTQLNI